MSTATRLTAYYEAEAEILKAQALGHGDRNMQRASLATVQSAIKELEAKLAAENLSASGQVGPVLLRGAFTGSFCGSDADYDERYR